MTKRWFAIPALLLLGVLYSGSSLAADLCVDPGPGGNDNNSGQEPNCYKTLVKAALNIVEGSTICLKAGVHAGADFAVSGSEFSPITVESCAGVAATDALVYNKVVDVNTSRRGVLTFANGVTDYIFNDFSFHPDLASSGKHGIYPWGSNHRFKFNRLEFHGTPMDGASLWALANQDGDDITDNKNRNLIVRLDGQYSVADGLDFEHWPFQGFGFSNRTKYSVLKNSKIWFTGSHVVGLESDCYDQGTQFNGNVIYHNELGGSWTSDTMQTNVDSNNPNPIFDSNQAWPCIAGTVVRENILYLNGEQVTDWKGGKYMVVERNAVLAITDDSSSGPAPPNDPIASPGCGPAFTGNGTYDNLYRGNLVFDAGGEVGSNRSGTAYYGNTGLNNYRSGQGVDNFPRCNEGGVITSNYGGPSTITNNITMSKYRSMELRSLQHNPIVDYNVYETGTEWEMYDGSTYLTFTTLPNWRTAFDSYMSQVTGKDANSTQGTLDDVFIDQNLEGLTIGFNTVADPLAGFDITDIKAVIDRFAPKASYATGGGPIAYVQSSMTNSSTLDIGTGPAGTFCCVGEIAPGFAMDTLLIDGSITAVVVGMTDTNGDERVDVVNLDRNITVSSGAPITVVYADGSNSEQIGAHHYWQGLDAPLGIADYCVSTTGDNSDTGAYPDNCFLDASEAAPLVVGGNTVCFFAGNHKGWNFSQSGSSGNIITWERCAGVSQGAVTIGKSGVDDNLGADDYLLYANSDVSFQKLDGLDFAPMLYGAGLYGLYHQNRNNDWEISNMRWMGATKTDLELYNTWQASGTNGRAKNDTQLWRVEGARIWVHDNEAHYWPFQMFGEGENTTELLVEDNVWDHASKQIVSINSSCLGLYADGFKTRNVYRQNKLGHSANDHSFETNADQGQIDPTRDTCRGGYRFIDNLVWADGESGFAFKGLEESVAEGNIVISNAGENDGNEPGDAIENSCMTSFIDGSGAQSRNLLIRNNVLIDNSGGIRQTNSSALYNNTLFNNSRDYLNVNGTICSNSSGISGSWGGPTVAVNNVVYNYVAQMQARVALAGTNKANLLERMDGNVYNSGGKWLNDASTGDVTYSTLASWVSAIDSLLLSGAEANSSAVAGPDDLFVDQNMETVNLGVPVEDITLAQAEALAARVGLKTAYVDTGEAIATVQTTATTQYIDVGDQWVAFCCSFLQQSGFPHDTVRINGVEYPLVAVYGSDAPTNAKTIELGQIISVTTGDVIDVVYPSGRYSTQQGSFEYWGSTFTPPPPSGYVIAASADDAEEAVTTGVVTITGTDLAVDRSASVPTTFTGYGLASDDDCRSDNVDGTGAINCTSTRVYIGTHDNWLRINSVDIPAGSTINWAYLDLAPIFDGSGGTINSDIYMQDSDAPTWTTGLVSDLPKLTSTVNWQVPASWATNVYVSSPDMKALIQELIDEAYWDSGDGMAVLTFHTNVVSDWRHYSWDNTGVNKPRIRINYTPP